MRKLAFATERRYYPVLVMLGFLGGLNLGIAVSLFLKGNLCGLACALAGIFLSAVWVLGMSAKIIRIWEVRKLEKLYSSDSEMTSA